MIFEYTLDLLESGRKTQTCRIARADEQAERGADGQIAAVTNKGRDKYRVGKTYAVQPGRGKPAVARIRLLGIEGKNIAEVTTAEAKAEGYQSREEFLGVWREIHGEKQMHADVWVLKFELVKDKT
ncbi:MAG TPA: ASCH domain-containing protein [Phototrophicaceae bacterium]|nr:ASCH domain-containing protein [Phototrophicaceae bacterium]